MNTIKTMLAAGAVAAGLAACASPQSDAPAASAAAVSPQAVSDAQLQRFASAARKVNAVSPASGEAAAAAATPTGQATNAVYDETNGLKAREIWSEGLTVEEFNAISAAVQQDPALMQRYSALANGTGATAPAPMMR